MQPLTYQGITPGADAVIVTKGADAGPEREARILKYQQRAERRLPLFRSGRATPDDRSHRCWACARRIVWGKAGLTPDRGVRRPFGTEVEFYCRRCFDRWGWSVQPVGALEGGAA